MSMSHAARSALLIGLPNFTCGCGASAIIGVPACVAHPAAASAASNGGKISAGRRRSGDRIFHLAIGSDRPREYAVVVLDEADDRANFGDVGDRRLHVAR